MGRIRKNLKEGGSMQNIYVGKNPDFSVLHLGQKQRMIGISSPLRWTDLRFTDSSWWELRPSCLREASVEERSPR